MICMICTDFYDILGVNTQNLDCIFKSDFDNVFLSVDHFCNFLSLLVKQMCSKSYIFGDMKD